MDSPVSASLVLGLQVCATTPGWYTHDRCVCTCVCVFYICLHVCVCVVCVTCACTCVLHVFTCVCVVCYMCLHLCVLHVFVCMCIMCVVCVPCACITCVCVCVRTTCLSVCACVRACVTCVCTFGSTQQQQSRKEALYAWKASDSLIMLHMEASIAIFYIEAEVALEPSPCQPDYPLASLLPGSPAYTSAGGTKELWPSCPAFI